MKRSRDTRELLLAPATVPQLQASLRRLERAGHPNAPIVREELCQRLAPPGRYSPMLLLQVRYLERPAIGDLWARHLQEYGLTREEYRAARRMADLDWIDARAEADRDEAERRKAETLDRILAGDEEDAA